MSMRNSAMMGSAMSPAAAQHATMPQQYQGNAMMMMMGEEGGGYPQHSGNSGNNPNADNHFDQAMGPFSPSVGNGPQTHHQQQQQQSIAGPSEQIITIKPPQRPQPPPQGMVFQGGMGRGAQIPAGQYNPMASPSMGMQPGQKMPPNKGYGPVNPQQVMGQGAPPAYQPQSTYQGSPAVSTSQRPSQGAHVPHNFLMPYQAPAGGAGLGPGHQGMGPLSVTIPQGMLSPPPLASQTQPPQFTAPQAPQYQQPGIMYQQSLQNGALLQQALRPPAPMVGQPQPQGPSTTGPMSPPTYIPTASGPRRIGQPFTPGQNPQRPYIHPGVCVMRLIHFGEMMLRRPEDNSIDFWKAFVNEFFASNGVMKYALWNSIYGDNRTFELNTALLARHYKVNFDSDIRNITVHMGNPKEYVLVNGLMLVDCPRAEVTHVFEDDRQVVSYGHLRVTFLQNLKIQIWEFHTRKHVELIPRNLLLRSRTNHEGDAQSEAVEVSLAPSQVNEYGATIKTMRCLEIAEVVCHLRDLMNLGEYFNLGPIATLRQFDALREVEIEERKRFARMSAPHPQQVHQMSVMTPGTPGTPLNAPNYGQNMMSPAGNFLGNYPGADPTPSPGPTTADMPSPAVGNGPPARKRSTAKRPSVQDHASPLSPEGVAGGAKAKKQKAAASATGGTGAAPKKKAPAKKKGSPSLSPEE